MSKVTMQDVRKRVSYLRENSSTSVSSNIVALYEKAIETGSVKLIETCINRWEELHSNKDLAGTMVIELFDKACETCNEGTIKKLCNLICEDTAPKVRDGKQTQTLINHKIGKFKIKLSTKINKNVENMKNAVADSLKGVKSNLSNNIDKMKDNAVKAKLPGTNKASEEAPEAEDKKDKTVEECYNRILETVECYIACDRLLANHNKLSKRFNIDKLVVENSNKMDVYDVVCQICEMVDTYKIPFKAKYNIALENSLYALEKNAISFNKKQIVEACTDYFLMNRPISENSKEENKDIEPDKEFVDLVYGVHKDLMDEYYKDSESASKDIVNYSSKAEIKKSGLKHIFNIDLKVQHAKDYSNVVQKLRLKYGFKKRESSKDMEFAKYNSDKSYIYEMSAVPTYEYGIVTSFKVILTMSKPTNTLIDKFDLKESYINSMTDVLENNKFFDKEDYEDVHYITNSDSDIQFDYFFDSEDSAYSTPIFTPKQDAETALMSENSYYVGNYDNIVLETKKVNEVKKLINDFKSNATEKTAEAVKTLIRKIYTKSAENIIEETPNFLNWIRVFFVFGTLAINPILGLVVTFTDYFIAMNLKRAETKKMLDHYNKELKKAKDKLEKLDADGEAAKRCKEYIKTLEKSIEKIDRYYESLHTEKENDDRMMNSTDDSSSSDDFDFDFGDDEFDISVETALLQPIEEDIEYLKDTDKDVILDDISHNLNKMNYDDIDNITDFALAAPMAVNPKALKECYEEAIVEARKMSGYSKYMMIDCLHENILKLSNISESEKSSLSIREEFNKLHNIREGVNVLIEMNSIYKEESFINEASASNMLKMASIKLQKTVQTLSDKEKAASKNIDVSMNNLSKSVEKAITNDNREAVIKGSVLPSASKIIKGAIATGAAWMINPAIAVIGALGAMAASSKFKAKERQLVLDEIEIELKMVDKYIKIAEEKDDMKALKQLLTTQRTLERERQRIKYRMVVHHQNAPDPQSSDDD